MPRISRIRRQPISSPECSDVEVVTRAAAAAPDPAASANEKGGLVAGGSREPSAEEEARKSGLSPASAVHEDVAREGSLVASDLSDLESLSESGFHMSQREAAQQGSSRDSSPGSPVDLEGQHSPKKSPAPISAEGGSTGSPKEPRKTVSQKIARLKAKLAAARQRCRDIEVLRLETLSTSLNRLRNLIKILLVVICARRQRLVLYLYTTTQVLVHNVLPHHTLNSQTHSKLTDTIVISDDDGTRNSGENPMLTNQHNSNL
jgi:hypothetical protein